MRLLLIDTCGAEGTLALADTLLAEPIVAMDRLPGRSASERLVPAIRAAMDALVWRLADLSAIVIVHGPGSFTGVRVGLSAAKGLSEASGVPLVAISRLAVLAGATGRVCVALDAGRGEFYFGEFLDGRCLREELLTQTELLEAAHGQVLLCEPRLAEALTGLMPAQLVPEPMAASALSLAVARVEADDFDDAALLDANYLRRTDAQLFARTTP